MIESERARKANERARSERPPAEDEHEDSATCPDCGVPGATDPERGETVCPDCGLVIEEDIVDRGPEWRAYSAAEDDRKSRVGAPQTERMHDRGLSTVIGWQDADAGGRTLSARQRARMSRLRTWDERFRTKDARERNLKQALGEIDRMGSALGLAESVRETASVIYRRALEEDLLPGRSIEGMATAALYAAARQGNTPRSLDECAAVSRVERRRIARAYKYLAAELDLAVKPADPEQYLPRFVSDLGLSEETERTARELVRTGKRAGVQSGKSPVGIAAAAIYAASRLVNEDLTQQQVAEVTDVSEVTIRNRYHDLLDAAERAEEPA